MAANNNSNDGFKPILKLSYARITDENVLPVCDLSCPEIRALYKYTECDEISNDFRIKYFKLPKPTSYPLDLNEGFEQYIFRRSASQCLLLDKVVKFILEAEENIIQPDKLEKVEAFSKLQAEPKFGKPRLHPKRKLVLSHRGVLTRMMIIPYRMKPSPMNNNTFYATRYCGILHLIDPVEYYGDESRSCTYHGKFEQICFSDDPDSEPVTDVPVDRNDNLFGIFRATLNEFNLIYSAEISGIIPENKIVDVHNLNEIRECKFIQSKLAAVNRNNDNFLTHPKCLLWWTQLYLTNTKDMCVGFRDMAGIVHSPVQLISVQDIPKNQNWKPKVCISFLNTMLTLIEETMSKVDCPYTVYEIKYDSYAKDITSKIHKGKTNLSFLPENYIEHCKQQIHAK